MCRFRRSVGIKPTREHDSPNPIAYQLRNPSVKDASDIWKLVADSEVLDRNSCYLYLLLCRDFAETCVVADSDEGLAGLITAYRPPLRKDVIFVWQVAVAEHARRQGLAKKMLHHLIKLPSCNDVFFLETTVTPSNKPSQRMFASFSEDLNVPYEVSDGFGAATFRYEDHEEEQLWRIGPLE